MATVSSRWLGGVGAITIPQLGEDLAATLMARGAPPKTVARVRLVIRVLVQMLGDQSLAAELVFTPEFVRRFLAAWGGSTRHNTVVAILGVLGTIGTFALGRGWLAPSEFDLRPIPIPLDWDEDHPSFRPVVARPGPGASDPGPIPTWDEIVTLTAYLKDPSRTRGWVGGRFFVLYSLAVLGGLQVAEALAIEEADFRPGRKLCIPMRSRIRRSRRDSRGERFDEIR
jgi:hypothetical protein